MHVIYLNEISHKYMCNVHTFSTHMHNHFNNFPDLSNLVNDQTNLYMVK